MPQRRPARATTGPLGERSLPARAGRLEALAMEHGPIEVGARGDAVAGGCRPQQARLRCSACPSGARTSTRRPACRSQRTPCAGDRDRLVRRHPARTNATGDAQRGRHRQPLIGRRLDRSREREVPVPDSDRADVFDHHLAFRRQFTDRFGCRVALEAQITHAAAVVDDVDVHDRAVSRLNSGRAGPLGGYLLLQALKERSCGGGADRRDVLGQALGLGLTGARVGARVIRSPTLAQVRTCVLGSRARGRV
jgi:hypothetical protein